MTVSYEPGYVTVSVTDSGNAAVAVSVDHTAGRARTGSGGSSNGGTGRSAASGGFGLAGIAERVASCGGSLSVGPGKAGGFAVTARLPAS